MTKVIPTDFPLVVATENNTVTIQSGQTDSSAIDSRGNPLLQIQIPAGFTASDITFLTSIDQGQTFTLLQDADGLIRTLAGAVASSSIGVPTTWLAGCHQFRIRTSVAQASTVEIRLGLRGVS